MTPYKVKSPVLFLIFNRPDTTLRVFEQIRLAQPSVLYVAADGPRPEKEGDAQLCKQAIEVLNGVDWNCTVKTLYRKENLGCKEAVSSAIDWFFEHVEEGIILEDDCLPSNSFFYFCDTLLEKYRHDTRIRHITGSNLQHGQTWGDASYYFSNLTHVWGWASWRRVWKEYDKDLKRFDEQDVKYKLKNVFNDDFAIETWSRIFSEVKAGKINTWDYQLTFLNFFSHGLSINPNKNLISNIGFRPDATHTPDPDNLNSNIERQEIYTITHPEYFLPEKAADHFTLAQDFNLEERWRRHNLLRRQFKRWLKLKIKSL
ncbi:nucleotide-diphospho-sugar transferase [Pedobacter sp. HMWF019]|uniref:nucleotide-diphospho-sugar transferase n=1 Tax=Pedobacter sp. HMWF019 TaxID=2056856 RepID=UPI000D358230|nr:nucleotide-diphospho-sugar transferase [Pedobacter sp. HMWF019]PTS95916.1 nucleotide-diphospho-sugar transferase [Pedobacter sp. HMWF019]